MDDTKTSTTAPPQPDAPAAISPAGIVDEYLRLLMGPEPATAPAWPHRTCRSATLAAD